MPGGVDPVCRSWMDVDAGKERQVTALAELDARLAIDVDEATWMVQARCLDADPEAFFPRKGGSTKEAKRICAACPVREECLEFSVENEERFGIWGGMSERERRRLRKQSA